MLFRWHAEPRRWLWACNTKRIQTGWLKFRELSGLLIGKGMSLKSKGIIYTTCIRPAMLYGQWDMANKDRGYKENAEEWNEDVEMDDRSEFKWKEKQWVCEEHAGNWWHCWSDARKQAVMVWPCWEERWVVLDKENWDTADRWWWSER